MPVARTTESRDAIRAMEALRRLVRALRIAGASAERELGVSAAQLFVLRQLALSPRQSLGELAGRTLTSQGSVSEVVTRLVAKRLVARRTADDDHRRLELSLTPEGRAVLARAPTALQERLVLALSAMRAAERRVLADALETWVVAAGLGESAAPMFFEGESGR